MKASLSIYRFDSGSKDEPRFDTFSIDMPANDSVLSALVKVYEECDPTLSFRYACGKIKCGECAVRVNGFLCLACKRRIEPTMVIEPLPNLPIIKDLVVDRNKVIHDSFALAASVFGSGSEGADTVDSQSIEDYVQLTDCFECLICQSVCPVLRKKPAEFPGAVGLLWIAQNRLAGGDSGKGIKSVVGLCTNCGRCWEACPSERHFLESAIAGLLGGS